ncbi:MAG: glutaredoxin family protein [Brevinematia bacterium]
MSDLQKVEGNKKKNVMLYALSTCIWCRKTKKLLEELDVEYSYVDVDLVDDEAEERFREEMKKWNPDCSFPTLVIDNKKCIVGFQEEEIRKELA